MKHRFYKYHRKQNTKKRISNRTKKRTANVILIIISRLSIIIVVWMEARSTPAIKPPKCPQQSRFMPQEPEVGVNMKINTMIMIVVHQILHFIAGPTKSKPFQFIIIYPTITPIIPKSAVEAPAETPKEFFQLQVKLKMFPVMPDIMYITSVFHAPKVYQILETNMKVVSTLLKRCMKQWWRNMAEISLQTYPFRTFGEQLAPYFIIVYALIFKRKPDYFQIPTEIQKMKSAMSANTNKMVRDRKLKLGQRVEVIISQQFQLYGFFTFFLPEMNKTLCVSAIRKCSSTTGCPMFYMKPGSLFSW